MFKGWIFNGTLLSQFWANIPYNTPYPTPNIPFVIETEENGLTVYRLNLLHSRNGLFKDIFSMPEKVIAISSEKIENLDATIYYFNSISRNVNSHKAWIAKD